MTTLKRSCIFKQCWILGGKMKESILAVFKQVFENEPLETFDQSWNVLLYWMEFPFIFVSALIFLLVCLILYSLFVYLKEKDDGAFFIIFPLGFVVVVFSLMNNYLAKQAYLDDVVVEKLLPKLGFQERFWLEQEKLKGVASERYRNNLSDKQKVGLEPVGNSIQFKELVDILKRDELKKF